MMFGQRYRNLTGSRPGFPDLTVLGDVIGRWFRLAGRRSTAGAALQHLGTLPLTTQSSLALVRVYKETLVLAITPQSVTLLTKAADNEISAPASADGVAPEPQSFGNL
jgi:flagellar biogenesis protein FliO